MDDNANARIHSNSEGGISGKHTPRADGLTFLVAPSRANEFNAATLPLNPLACWRVDDIRFDFDSSFVLPDIQEEVQLLANLIADHTFKDSLTLKTHPPPISIFGHADPVGKDDYNKFLSGRRAAAVYAMLTRREEIWEDIYSGTGQFTHPLSGDKWGIRTIQMMLTQLGFPTGADGEMGPETRSRIQQFQGSKGLVADGDPGPATRKQLFHDYMDAICVDDNGHPFQIDKQAGFLAHNSDASGKGDFQGCGEFNPMLIFSGQDSKVFEESNDKSDRNAANSPNRRVVAFLFRPGSIVIPAKWPCPLAKEGTRECIARFWSDGETRRNKRLPDQPRKFEETHDTFACRFYQRLSDESPCERLLTAKSHISVLLRSNSGAVPLPGLQYRIVVDSGFELNGKTGEDGLIEHPHVPPGDYPLELNGVKTDTLIHTQPLPIERCPLRIPDFQIFDDVDEPLPDASETDEVMLNEVDLSGLEPADGE